MKQILLFILVFFSGIIMAQEPVSGDFPTSVNADLETSRYRATTLSLS